MLFNGTRIALHFHQGTAYSSLEPDCTQSGSSEVCCSAAQNILALVRKYKSRYGLQHAPIIFIYGIIQAIRSLNAFGSSQEESQYLLQALGGSAITWGLARQVGGPMFGSKH
jgi:hypothetical protein